VFYYSPKQQTYHKKLAQIRVKGFVGTKERTLGETELDISAFVGSQNIVKTLQLTKTPVKAQKGYISIQISIQKEGGDAATAHLKDDSGSSCSEEEAIED